MPSIIPWVKSRITLIKKTTNEREVANTAKVGIGDNLDVNGYDGFALSH